MLKISSLGQLKEIVNKKMANDVAEVFKSAETLLSNMLTNVIQERVYNAYDPVYYRRTNTLKNSITTESGYGKYSGSTSVIVARTYIDKDKLKYSNGVTDVPQRLNEDRVKRREDRWRTPEKSSHFSTYADKGLLDTSIFISNKLQTKGYIKK